MLGGLLLKETVRRTMAVVLSHDRAGSPTQLVRKDRLEG